jgi:hypothetical protein
MGEPVIFTEVQGSNEAWKTEIYLILGNELLFWDQKGGIFESCIEFRDEVGAQRRQKSRWWKAENFYRGPSILSAALGKRDS